MEFEPSENGIIRLKTGYVVWFQGEQRKELFPSLSEAARFLRMLEGEPPGLGIALPKQ